jgi:chorismate mutase/prephenate dehydratase
MTESNGSNNEDTVDGSLNSESIVEVRENINRVDEELLRLLAERRGYSRQMAEAKQQERFPIRDREREEALLVDRIRKGRTHGLDANYVTSVYHAVIDDSVRLQQQILQRRANPEAGSPEVARIAIQGVEGSYSHLSARKFFGRSGVDIVLIEGDTFEDVIDAVEKGAADYGMLPVENTTSGGINPVYDVLLHARVSIVGEEKFKVEHCLAAKPETRLADVRQIFSHPQAVAQCQKYLRTLSHARVEYFNDTAAAVKMVAESQETGFAAIASEEAARLYGLKILARDIASQPENYTRFLIAARKPRNVDPRIPTKTSLVMATSQEPGALLRALDVFRDREINLTKLESRPIIGNPWEEMFYVDFEGNIADESIEQALDELSVHTRFLKVLGSYPSEDLPPTELSSEAKLASRDVDEGEMESTPELHPVAERPTAEISLKDAEERGFRRASRAYKEEDSVVKVRNASFGGNHFSIIAGPAFVRGHEQIRACASAAHELGAHVVRAGARFIPSDPEVSPDSADPVQLLAEAGREVGMPVVTNVSTPEEVKRLSDSVDLLMISARNMMNHGLLREVGRTHRPVLLKRGWMSSVDELLQSAEIILGEGNRQVILCERGIRTFETATQNTLDLTAIPLLRSLTHLPVIVDPSRAAGRADLVKPLALAARAAGAHGVMVEIDTSDEQNPRLAEALSFEQFENLMRSLVGTDPGK